MARKIQTIYDEKAKTLKKIEELEQLAQQAEMEEKTMIENAEKQIQGVADSINMFCGVILSKQDIVAIVDLALKTNESVKIPFKLYFKE